MSSRIDLLPENWSGDEGEKSGKIRIFAEMLLYHKAGCRFRWQGPHLSIFSHVYRLDSSSLCWPLHFYAGAEVATIRTGGNGSASFSVTNPVELGITPDPKNLDLMLHKHDWREARRSTKENTQSAGIPAGRCS